MTATLLDGKAVSEKLLESLIPEVKKLDPKLVIVQLGDDPASASYIKHKTKSCEKVGMRYEHTHLPENTSFDELLDVIHGLNSDDDVTGFIVQLPLPGELQNKVPQIIKEIDPKKDVDGFCAYNLGKMFLSTEYEHLPPATPAGIITLLDHYNIDVEGKHAVIVGHSNLVGKPISVMLLNRNATISVCHIHTEDLGAITKQADILVVAVGKPGLISQDMVKDGVIVIDVGITATDDGLKGDVDFDAIKEKASAITPVPGGVGPMTVASLIKNCVTAKKRQLESYSS